MCACTSPGDSSHLHARARLTRAEREESAWEEYTGDSLLPDFRRILLARVRERVLWCVGLTRKVGCWEREGSVAYFERKRE